MTTDNATTIAATITARDLDSLAPCEGAVDADIIVGGKGVGSVTYVPGYDGELAPYGDQIDTWADHRLQRYLDQHWDGADSSRDDVIAEITAAVQRAAAQ